MSDQKRAENAARLIARIEAEAQAECAEIIEQAQTEAAALVAAARADADVKLHRVIGALRTEGAQDVARMRSKAETENRRRRQLEGARFQAQGMAVLQAALDALWRDPVARATWIDNILTEARAPLFVTKWYIGHPAGWAKTEKDRVIAAVRDHTGEPPEVDARPDLTAGLVLRANSAVIDGSAVVLARDTLDLRALLQGEIEQQLKDQTP